MAIRECATHAPAAAAPGIARTISHFVGQVLADAPKDVAPALRELRNEQVARRGFVHESWFWLRFCDAVTLSDG
ncbi:hypothetical protein [Streptomyces sp. AHA2]|uniref:hypothetical protein n=1 Tax=Streptomyces sp. AHA2 TaxID=3064526 RepID=UPI002FDFFC62